MLYYPLLDAFIVPNYALGLTAFGIHSRVYHVFDIITNQNKRFDVINLR